MTRILQIQDCSGCPFLSNTGAFTPGGAKPLCRHDTSTRNRLGREGGLSKLTIPKYPKPPKWCPLPEIVPVPSPSGRKRPQWRQPDPLMQLTAIRSSLTWHLARLWDDQRLESFDQSEAQNTILDHLEQIKELELFLTGTWGPHPEKADDDESRTTPE